MSGQPVLICDCGGKERTQARLRLKRDWAGSGAAAGVIVDVGSVKSKLIPFEPLKLPDIEDDEEELEDELEEEDSDEEEESSSV